MKLLLIAILFLFSSVPTYAALDDVVLNTGTIISIGGESVEVSGSNAIVESIAVHDNNFVVTLDVAQTALSSIHISSPTNKEIITNTENYTSSDTCSGLTLTGSSAQADVTVSLGGTCSGGTATGGGGGGGGSSSRRNQTTPMSPPPAVPPPSSLPFSFMFLTDLQVGSFTPDVYRLQTILSSRSDLYPEGTVSGYFGPLTLRAVEKFQIAYGIAKSGDAGYGRVGPKTRAKLQEVFSGVGNSAAVAPVTPTSPSGIQSAVIIPANFTRTLKKGVSGVDVLSVQKILNSNPETRVAETGPGSPGNETELFGSLTESAVQKFQIKYGIASPGELGYGWVGPKTKAKLEQI